MNWKRNLAAGLLSAALTLSSTNALTITIDGRTMDDPFFVEKGTTYVYLRDIVSYLDGARAEWRGARAWIITPEATVTAKPGDRWLEAGGRYFYAPLGVRTVDGHVVAPLRALAEALGAQVSWDRATDRGTITTGRSAPAGDAEEGKPAYSEQDLYWLSRIISAESQGEPLEGKLAVGTVVLNRVASSEFPDTIYDVIFDRKWGVQFTPVANGTVYLEPTEESVTAAKMVLAGAREAGNSLYFLDPTQTSNHWTIHNRTYVTTIGCHQFYS